MGFRTVPPSPASKTGADKSLSGFWWGFCFPKPNNRSNIKPYSFNPCQDFDGVSATSKAASILNDTNMF
jgi:hypothetical protein